jgi:hypothetical protein
MTRAFDFTRSRWMQLERDWGAWWAGELGRPIVTIVTRDPGTYPPPGDDFLTRFPLEMPADAVIDYFETRLKTQQFYADAVPKWWVNLGAGIVGAYLGAGTEYGTGTTWFHPLKVETLADVHLVYDANNVWWQRTQEITRAAVDRWVERGVMVAYTDLGGNLDILASLRGTGNLLLDVIEAPEEVDRLVSEITALWLRFFNELDALFPPEQYGRAAWAPPWSPGRGYMLQSDFCYMISPRMFERFVMPDLITCCDAIEYPFYHMDGKGQLAHLDMLLSIEKLRGIQWQPGDGQPLADDWLDVLRRIRDAGKLCQVYVTLDGALKIVRELGGKGFLFDIQDQGVTITEAEIEAFFVALEKVGV